MGIENTQYEAIFNPPVDDHSPETSQELGLSTCPETLEKLDAVDEQSVSLGGLKRVVNAIGRYKTKVAIGLTVGSVGSTLFLDPMGQLEHEVIRSAPIVGSGLLVGEAAWIGGAAMMLAAVGEHIRNPLKIKKEIGAVATKANDSKMFRSGFWINTIGAVGEFGVITAGVMTQLPPEAWGWLSLGFADLAATIYVRKKIHAGIKDNLQAQPSSDSVVAG